MLHSRFTVDFDSAWITVGQRHGVNVVERVHVRGREVHFAVLGHLGGDCGENKGHLGGDCVEIMAT